VSGAERSLHDDRVLITTREPVRVANVITGWALERGVELEHFSVTQPTLEDIYLELTGTETSSVTAGQPDQPSEEAIV
jgi:hypothetical protein